MMQLMGSSPDWQKLFIQGRCKAIGTPRSEEEKQEIMNSTTREQTIAKLRKESGVKHSFEEVVENKLKKEELEEKVKIIEQLQASVVEEKEPEPQIEEEVVVDTTKVDISSLREQYVEKFNKRPFMGWDIEKLQEKLAE